MSGSDRLEWLLAPENPSAHYLALTRLLGRPENDAKVGATRAAIPAWGAARDILAAQWPAGYWMRPGVGHSPKHKATVWQVIFLAALGAPRTPAIDRACAYVIDHSRLPDGRFSAHKTARGAVPCLNGNLIRALLQLGYEAARLGESIEALAEMVARDGFCCRFNAAGRPARMEDGLPCAWGAVKVLGGLARVPEEERSPAVRSAIDQGLEFLLAPELATGGFPVATGPSHLWTAFGFPLGYTSDLLEAVVVLTDLGLQAHPALMAAVEVVASKQDEAGRWRLEYVPANTWASFGRLGWPNKWLTLRALRVLGVPSVSK